MTPTTMAFGRYAIRPEDTAHKRVLDVGALNVNGSFREFIDDHQQRTPIYRPATYIGVDLSLGLGVDQIVDATKLVERFGECAFELVISTELLEHVQDWELVVEQLKRVTTENGIVILTTRTPGFGRHGFPDDFWRFTFSDMVDAFADFCLELVEYNASDLGVYVRARKPSGFVPLPRDLYPKKIWSMK